jgi:hypothetical protein
MQDTYETIEYKNRQINIYQESYAENPFENWDCNPPILVNYDRSLTSYGKQYGDLSDVPTLTREQIKANLSDIISLCDCQNLLELTENRRDYYNLTDCINDRISEFINDSYTSERIDLLAEVYKFAGFVVLNGSSRGYCQGDCAEVLIVATKEFLDATGAKIESEKDLQSTLDLYSAWAWGDVFYYNIDEIDESCGGFYGTDHEKSGLLEMAKNAIDCYESDKLKKRVSRTKRYIKNKVA